MATFEHQGVTFEVSVLTVGNSFQIGRLAEMLSAFYKDASTDLLLQFHTYASFLLTTRVVKGEFPIPSASATPEELAAGFEAWANSEVGLINGWGEARASAGAEKKSISTSSSKRSTKPRG